MTPSHTNGNARMTRPDRRPLLPDGTAGGDDIGWGSGVHFHLRHGGLMS